MKFTLQKGSFDPLICDCDGTLVDSAPLYLTSLQVVLAEYGLDLKRERYLARTGLAPVTLVSGYEDQTLPMPADKMIS